MRIIVCNKYYFETGGPERYMFGLMDLLQRAGHEVIPFSVAAARNRPTEYASYFVSSPVGEAEYDSKLIQRQLRLSTKIRMAGRAMYSREARTKLRTLIRDVRPDLVYVLNFTSYLSPSIIDAAHDERLPVVVRLSSFDLICATHAFLRNGQICTECLNGKFHSVVHRCVGGSLSASVAKFATMSYHDAIRIYERVDAFVAPAQFTKKMMIEGGFPSDRIHHIPTFVDVNRFHPRAPHESGDDYVLYFGRIAPDKGLGVLVDAYAHLGPAAPPLVLMGRSEPDEEQRLRARCADLHLSNVHFVAPRQGDELVKTIQHALFIVAPSIWFDNTPNTVYEAFACARPVIATNIGSLPEQVVHEHNGLLFKLHDAEDLARQMDRLIKDPHYAHRLGTNASLDVQTEYSGRVHVERLLTLFNRLANTTSVQHGSSTVSIVTGAASDEPTVM